MIGQRTAGRGAEVAAGERSERAPLALGDDATSRHPDRPPAGLGDRGPIRMIACPGDRRAWTDGTWLWWYCAKNFCRNDAEKHGVVRGTPLWHAIDLTDSSGGCVTWHGTAPTTGKQGRRGG